VRYVLICICPGLWGVERADGTLVEVFTDERKARDHHARLLARVSA